MNIANTEKMVLRTTENEKAGGAALTIKNPIHHSFWGANSTRLLSVLFVSNAEHKPVWRNSDPPPKKRGGGKSEPNDRLIAITCARQQLLSYPAFQGKIRRVGKIRQKKRIKGLKAV